MEKKTADPDDFTLQPACHGLYFHHGYRSHVHEQENRKQIRIQQRKISANGMFLVNKIFSLFNYSTNMQLQNIKQQLSAGRNIFLAGTLLIMTILIIAACQKSADKPYPRAGFDAAAAKEWYYGSFKNSTEYNMYDKTSGGSKLPDWSKGRHVKIGDYEAMEFPLNRQKAKVSIAENAAATEMDRNRIAQASVARILFIRKGDQTLVREVLYIPDLEYLARHQYDISSNGSGNLDKDFSGTIQVKDWAGNEISRSIVIDGKVKKRVRGNQILLNNTTPANGRITCNGTLVTEYERQCEVHIYSDNMVTQECGEWYPTGNQWCYESEVANPCEDPASPQCACQEYGLCEGGDGSGGNEETCDQKQQKLQGETDNTIVSSVYESQSQNTRVKYYDWVFYKQNFGLWKYISHDKGVHVQENGFWRWESISHESVSRTGVVIGGTLNLTINTAPTWHSLVYATMTLNFTVTASVNCMGYPITWSNDYTASKLFGLND